MAWTAVFLASDESRWISGVVIPVDGGVLAAQPLLGYELLSGPGPAPIGATPSEGAGA